MNSYMVTVELPEELDEQFMSLIPEQRRVVHDLMLKGTILGYALAETTTANCG